MVKGNIKAVGVTNDNAEDKTKWKWVMMFWFKEAKMRKEVDRKTQEEEEPIICLGYYFIMHICSSSPGIQPIHTTSYILQYCM